MKQTAQAQSLGTLRCACGQSATNLLIAKGVKGYPYRKGEEFAVCQHCADLAMEGPSYIYIAK